MDSINNLSFTGFKDINSKTEEAGGNKKRHYANKGFFRSQYATQFAAAPASLVSLGIMKAMKKVSDLNPEDTVTLRKATQEGLKNTGLYDKGVRVYHMHDVKMPKTKDFVYGIANNLKKMGENPEELFDNSENLFDKLMPIKYGKKDQKALKALQGEMDATSGKITKVMEKFMPKSKEASEELNNMQQNMFNTIKDVSSKVQALIFKTGNNACYLPHVNKIITPEKSLQTSVFHEMGHALNNNGGGFLKGLQKARPVAMLLPGVILTASLLNKRKTTDEKSDSKVQNFFDGVKKNAGKLSFLAMTPVIAEETIASLRGNSIAKDLFKNGQISKSLLNKVRATNLCSFASYMSAGLIAGATAAFAVKVKDNIQEKYEAKKNAKYDARDAKIQAKIEAKEAKKAAKANNVQ